MSMKVLSYNGLNINDGSNYTALMVEGDYGLPAVGVSAAARSGRWPAVTGIVRPGAVKTVRIFIDDLANVETLREGLMQAFDPEDETAHALVVTDRNGANNRYVNCICRALDHDRGGNGRVFVATLDVDGDVRWRKVALVTAAAWNITGDSDTNIVSNDGEDDAYPKFTITPTATKTGFNVFKRWIPIIWHVEAGVSSYPLDVVDDSLDTAALVTASKMQADGDDIRVVVDGVEVDYWLDGMNTTTTKIWANLDFAAAPATLATLESAIASGASVTTIDSATDISGYPSSGILLINAEAFTYTGKNDSLNRFTGVTRAAKGTTAANHSASDTIYWIQRDVWVTYGNAAAAAFPSDDDYKPAFNLSTSTNTSWDYDDFGEDDGRRSGSWSFVNFADTSKYTADQATDADPWEEMGIAGTRHNSHGRWQLYNPCGITNANMQNGHKYASNTSAFRGHVVSKSPGGDWATRYNIPAPSAVDTWETWSNNTALGADDLYAGLRMLNAGANIPGTFRVEVADVTLTLDSNNTPTITVGAEQGNYPLACILRNNTTGDELRITMTMEENEDLEVDTDEKTVTYLADGSNQFGAVEVRGDVRNAWLKLVPGNNELYFEDTGTTGLTIVTEWEERSFD